MKKGQWSMCIMLACVIDIHAMSEVSSDEKSQKSHLSIPSVPGIPSSTEVTPRNNELVFEKKRASAFIGACNNPKTQEDLNSVLESFLTGYDLTQDLADPSFLTNENTRDHAHAIFHRRYNIKLLFRETTSHIVIITLLTDVRTAHLFDSGDILAKMNELAQTSGNSEIIEAMVPCLKKIHGVADDDKLPEGIQRNLQLIRQGTGIDSARKKLKEHVDKHSDSSQESTARTHQTIQKIHDTSCCCDNCCCETCCTVYDCFTCWKDMWRALKNSC